MIARKVNSDQMYQALAKLNKKYKGNITWNRFDVRGKTIKFTLKCISSSGPGHRLGQQEHKRKLKLKAKDIPKWLKLYKLIHPEFDIHEYLNKYEWRRKRLSSCCWHVWGNFIDKLFELNPDIIIYSRGKKHDINSWQWEDWNAGSIMNPIFISTLCEC